MLLDEESLKMIGSGLDWNDELTMGFLASHYRAILKLTQSTALRHIEINDPDRMQEINQLLESVQKEDIVNGYKTVIDQIELELISFPDLKSEIDQIVKEYGSDMLFKYLETAPTEAVLELIKHMKTQLLNYDRYIQIYETVKKRVGNQKVKEVLGEI